MAFKKYEGVPLPTDESGKTIETSDVGFELNDVTFYCLPDPPAILYHGLRTDMWYSAQVIEFMKECLLPHQVELFLQVISDKKRIVPVATLATIMTDLIEEYTNRPTVRPTGSSSGPTGTEDGSTAISSAAE